MKYRDLFSSQREFFRSVRIDLDGSNSNRNYITTPLFGLVAERILSGLVGNGPRAITITGPYGSGKSATALQIAKLLETQNIDMAKQLNQVRPDLSTMLEMCEPAHVLLITGTSARVGSRIVDQLKQIVATDHPEILDRLATVNTDDFDSIIDIINVVRTSNGTRPLLLVIDELGKHLEHAAVNPDSNDVYLLQMLAEYAERVSNPRMSFVGILHQSFENYGNRLLRSQREEFAKVQGRFEDIAFQLQGKDTVRIIGNKVSSTCIDEKRLAPIRDKAANIGAGLYELGMVPEGLSLDDFRQVCRQAAPLHPATLLLLGPLFRNFAQNERSLFSMLGSSEPNGFQRFLDEVEYIPEAIRLYGLPELFEYIASSLGGAIYHSTVGGRWVGIEEALVRIGDEQQNRTRDLIKALGLINITSSHRLTSSKRALQLILNQDIDSELEHLMTKSIVIHRRFEDSYRLWDGSDIDVEERLEEARKVIGIPPLVPSLMELVPPRPITARKHSMQTGTLRWFETVYIEPTHLHELFQDVQPLNADGRLYVVIATDKTKVPESIELQKWQIAAWVHLPLSIWEAVCELSYIRWVHENTPELRLDDVARREVIEREHSLQQQIEIEVNNHLLRPNQLVQAYIPGDCKKIYGGQLNTLISQMCDALFPKSPTIINEFVNRNSLSSNATKARNDVLRGIIEREHLAFFGITGYPPELPIYLSTLRNTGLHVQVDEDYRLTEPVPGSPWYDAWNYVKQVISDTYLSVSELWHMLSMPPFGIRKGLLPVLTVAFVRVNQHSISLLEQENFVPEMTWPVIERMLKNPDAFQLKLSRLSGTRESLIKALVNAGILHDSRTTEKVGMLTIVRPLVSFAYKLPDYTKHTKTISKESALVRDALLNAKEPSHLIYASLPQALGLGPIESDTGPEFIPQFVTQLVDCIRELADAYNSLLESIQSALLDAFGMKGVFDRSVQQLLIKRAGDILPVVNDLDVKAVIWRMAQELSVDQWTESVGSVVANKPPKSWFDRTISEFEVDMHLIARKMEHYETVASIYPKTSLSTKPIRLSMTIEGRDFETVMPELMDADEQSQIADILRLVEDLNGDRSLLLAATELLKRYFNKDSTKEDTAIGEQTATHS